MGRSERAAALYAGSGTGLRLWRCCALCLLQASQCALRDVSGGQFTPVGQGFFAARSTGECVLMEGVGDFCHSPVRGFDRRGAFAHSCAGISVRHMKAEFIGVGRSAGILLLAAL